MFREGISEAARARASREFLSAKEGAAAEQSPSYREEGRWTDVYASHRKHVPHFSDSSLKLVIV